MTFFYYFFFGDKFFYYFLFGVKQLNKLYNLKFTTIWNKNLDDLLEYLGYIVTNYKTDVKFIGLYQ